MKMAKRNSGRRWDRRLQLLVFPLLAVLMAAALFLVTHYITGETQTKLEEPVYQYFLDQKVGYDPGTKILPGNNRIMFDEDGQQNDGDPTPIYYENSTSILLPTDMSWMDPATNREWRLPAFSRLEMDGDGVVWYCGSGDSRIRMESGFLGSGRGTYVFLDDVTMMFNGTAYEMGPLSFYSVSNGMYRIYRYQVNELITETEAEENVTVWAQEGYQADLSIGIYTAADGNQRLLAAAPSVLKEIGER